MLNHHKGTAARRDGLDLVLSLTPDQADALGTDAYLIGEAVDTFLVGLAALRMGRDPRPTSEPTFKDRPVSSGDIWDEWVLQDVTSLINRLTGTRDAVTRAHQAHGGSYSSLATATGVTKATAQSRRDSLAKSDPSSAELWATGRRGDVHHPGVAVPSNMRPWSNPWHGYIPVDVTPDELTPAGLATARPGWAEPFATPYDVPDWSARRAAALVPYEFDDRRWPLNPQGRTGRTGRNLGKWGENQAVDAVVLAGTGADRRVLLIKRGDIEEWAIPGGMVDADETVPAALVRELREETGVDLAAPEPEIVTRTCVDDWRNTDHAWIASTVAVFRIPDALPATAADDATEARWLPAVDLDQLTAAVEAIGGKLYKGHRTLLAQALQADD